VSRTAPACFNETFGALVRADSAADNGRQGSERASAVERI
jgi:hypothetical protein